MSFFGRLVGNTLMMPLRVTALPMKLVADILESETAREFGHRTTKDTLQFLANGKSETEIVNGFFEIE